MHLKWDFEKTIVDALKNKYNVDILTPEFSPSFTIEDFAEDKDNRSCMHIIGNVFFGLPEEFLSFGFDIAAWGGYCCDTISCTIEPDWERNPLAMEKYKLPKCSEV